MGHSLGNPRIESSSLVWSQQDFDHDWREESWPVDVEGVIDCLNPSCNSSGFARARLFEIISDAIDSGGIVAGSMRCEGMDRANVTPCTNALVYLFEDE